VSTEVAPERGDLRNEETATTRGQSDPHVGAASRETLSDRFAHLTMRLTQWLGMHLPRGIGLPAAQAYFRLLYEQSSAQRDVVAANLSRVLGHPPESRLVQDATRECFKLYGRYWYETFSLRTMPPEEVDRRFSIEGLENVDRALEQGRGTVLTLPHMGNWDAAGHWLCIKGYRMTAVAEELKPRSVFELFLRHRRALGMGIVPLSTSANVGSRLVELLRQNEILTLVADRDLTGRGVVVEMFGAPRRMPAGPAYLALATETPLSVCAVFTTPSGWHTKIGPPVEIDRTGVMREDVAALTKVIAAGFERYIASSPADWHMFQPAWDESGETAGGMGSAAPS
jgi:phosphatidylinositol dimannoside acyltransferase